MTTSTQNTTALNAAIESSIVGCSTLALQDAIIQTGRYALPADRAALEDVARSIPFTSWVSARWCNRRDQPAIVRQAFDAAMSRAGF